MSAARSGRVAGAGDFCLYQGTSESIAPNGLASGMPAFFLPLAPKILGNPTGFSAAFVTTDEKSGCAFRVPD